MAYNFVVEGMLDAKLIIEPIVEEPILSDSKRVVLSGNPDEFQGFQSNNTASNPRKRKRRKNHNWSHKRIKRPTSSKQISRAVYPVSYQYTREDLTQKKETGNFSSKHAIEVASTAPKTTLNDSKKVITPVSCNIVEPEDSQCNNIVSGPRKRRRRKKFRWTHIRRKQRQKTAEQNTREVGPSNSNITLQKSSQKEETRGELYSKTPTAAILSGASTRGGIVMESHYDCWLYDHTYSMPNRCVVRSTSATSCSTITADEDVNDEEEPLRIHAPCHDERAESTSSVDFHLLVINRSPPCDKDPLLVSDQSAGRDVTEVDDVSHSQIDDQIDDADQIDYADQIDDLVQIKSEVLSVSSEEPDSGSPSFWDELEASVRPVLPFPWMTRASDGKLSLMRIPVRNNIAVQIGITFYSSDTQYFVHNRPLPSDHQVRSRGRHLGTLTLREAVDTVLRVVSTVDTLNVCPGARGYGEFWNRITDGFAEENLCSEDEGDYKVLRSQNCTLLVRRMSACVECKKIVGRLRRFKSNAMDRPTSQDPSKFFPNHCLSSAQQMRKLADLQKLVKLQNKKIARLTKGRDNRNNIPVGKIVADVLTNSVEKIHQDCNAGANKTTILDSVYA